MQERETQLFASIQALQKELSDLIIERDIVREEIADQRKGKNIVLHEEIDLVKSINQNIREESRLLKVIEDAKIQHAIVVKNHENEIQILEKKIERLKTELLAYPQKKHDAKAIKLFNDEHDRNMKEKRNAQANLLKQILERQQEYNQMSTELEAFEEYKKREMKRLQDRQNKLLFKERTQEEYASLLHQEALNGKN